MAMTTLPSAPTRANPNGFAAAADTFVSALPQFVTEANTLQTDITGKQADVAARQADIVSRQTDVTTKQTDIIARQTDVQNNQSLAAASAASAINAPGTSATSTSSLTLATGAQTLTLAQTGKAFALGQTVVVASTASPVNQMTGVITAFNSGTGALSINVTATPLGSGTFSAWTVSLTGQQGTAAAQQMIRVARASNNMLTSTDVGKYFDVSGSFTQTFDTPANLGTSWYAWYANNGSGDITIPSSDGISNWVMYPGAVRLFQCDGSSLRSMPIRAGTKTFSSSGSHSWPPGIATCFIQALAAGGGGASGYNTAGSNGFGGPGGGGGEYLESWIKGISAGTSTAVTIAAGGSGGAARTSSGTPIGGGIGGNTSFGTFVKALGGSGGNITWPGQGGGMVVGSSKQTGALWLTGNGTLSSNFDVGTDAAGGFGAGLSNNAGLPGYRSLRGGGGGGSGGALDGALNPYAGGTGGGSGRNASALSNNTGGGPAGGAVGTNGAAGTQPTDSIAGHGGSGGGSVVSGTGGTGGAGGLGAGGGGGGAVSTGTSGAGGAGGNGICIVTEVI